MADIKDLSSNSIPSPPMYSFASPRRQDFSIPASFIHYLTKTPSNPKGYKKLIQTCKHFTSKNYILPIQNICIEYLYGEGYWDDRNILEVLYFNTKNYRIWATERLFIIAPNIASKLVVPRIYRCEAIVLELETQSISYDEYLLFVSSGTVKNLMLTNTDIKYENGEVVPIEILFKKVVPKITEFTYDCIQIDSSAITASTAQNLIEIEHLQSLNKFELVGIPGVFEYKTFFNFSMKYLACGGVFAFRKEISLDYQNQLQKYVNDIIKNGKEGILSNIPKIHLLDETEDFLF